ncbi:MAG TPA: DNA-3-methyladenine glycosylase I [Actinobacteria bacterium]|nr:DNA-3-methyladenine glycosylase I [Actinomycetota bacterium]
MSVLGDDGRRRCAWGDRPDVYRRYHDTEWGRPVADDPRLFEKLVLEGFQAGLSWLTILRKRPAFRDVFAGFSPEAVAAFDDADVARLLDDPRIVRHRGKIEAAIHNAARVLEVADEWGSFAAYVWSWEPEPSPPTEAATTPAAEAFAADLRRRGFRFVGPTTVYAFMQAMGLVDDHEPDCHVREEVEAERARFVRPGPRGAPPPSGPVGP